MQNKLHPSVSRTALHDFVQQSQQQGIQLQTLQLFQQDECLVHWAVAPYQCNQKREMYSISKSFASTAAGVAFGQQKLHPDDLVLGYFPEYKTLCSVDERWSRLKLRHLLSMTSGHASCVMPQVAFANDGVAAFFSAPLAHEPGSFFAYNTAASYLVAEVVYRATATTVPQLLAETLFPALGIDDFAWETCVDGRCQGGTGLSISAADLAKLGLLYLNEGVWQGKQLLPKEWVQMASSLQTQNGENGTVEWCSGYGFQFWMNQKEGFRGDGAYGQLCVVLPQSRQVAVVTAECNNMSAELDILWQLLEHLHDADPVSLGVEVGLPGAYLANGQLLRQEFDTGVLQLTPNPTGMTSLRLQQLDGKVTAFFGNAQGVQTVSATADAWTENTLIAPNLRPTLVAQMPRQNPQTMRFSAFVSSDETGVTLHCRSLNTPHAFEMHFTFVEDGLTLDFLSELGVFGEEKRLFTQPKTPNGSQPQS